MNASGRPARYGPTLRLRLTAVATALLATGLILSGALVYLTLDRTLSLEVDRALADRARVVIASITVNASPDGLSIQLPDVDAIAAGGAVVQVTGFDGTIVRSASLGRVTLEVSRGALAAAQRGQVFFETVTVEQVQLRVHAPHSSGAATPWASCSSPVRLVQRNWFLVVFRSYLSALVGLSSSCAPSSPGWLREAHSARLTTWRGKPDQSVPIRTSIGAFQTM